MYYNNNIKQLLFIKNSLTVSSSLLVMAGAKLRKNTDVVRCSALGFTILSCMKYKL